MQDCVMEKKSEHALLGLYPYTVAIMSSQQCSLILHKNRVLFSLKNRVFFLKLQEQNTVTPESY